MKDDLLEKANKVALVSTKSIVEQCRPKMLRMLNNDENAANRFLSIISTNMGTSLIDCTPTSIIGAMFMCAELKLEPVAGRAYILPFKNSKKVDGKWIKVTEAQFILGYKGAVDLFYRHASAISLSWGVVHENDEFDFERGSSSSLKHKRSFKDRGEKIAYWVGANVNGDFLFDVMSYEDCISHGHQHSKSSYEGKFGKNSPWLKSEDSMCLKTVLFQLSKTLPLSVEIQRGIQADETTKYVNPLELHKAENLLDAPDQTNWNDESETPKEKDNI